jgi:hypothetical protein
VTSNPWAWQPWAMSGAEIAAANRELPPPGLLPDETWHATRDLDDEDAAEGEAREFRWTLYGGRGECD